MPKAKKITSQRWRLNKQDVAKWAKNAFIFSIPALLVLLASFQEIVPRDASWGVLALYIINVLTDLLRKFANETK